MTRHAQSFAPPVPFVKNLLDLAAVIDRNHLPAPLQIVVETDDALMVTVAPSALAHWLTVAPNGTSAAHWPGFTRYTSWGELASGQMFTVTCTTDVNLEPVPS